MQFQFWKFLFVIFQKSSKLIDEKSSVIIGAFIYLIGILCALSFNVLEDVKILGLGFFDLFDKATTNWLLPIGSILIALFFGWKLGKKAIDEALTDVNQTLKTLFLWIVRLVAPIGVLIVLITKLNLDMCA